MEKSELDEFLLYENIQKIANRPDDLQDLARAILRIKETLDEHDRHLCGISGRVGWLSK